ncbi:DUF3320 domain-containing protein [Streptomyces sp. JJ38]|uniref:DUF3320 domain-containing protein n=1 Tax=Streptomyces sp. JJ38 TaxID=2738128 RepID=UPI001C59C8EF|nr:DUF3320 domain-containing protein [Streptomyces sp. JJ38]MBW1597415.1 DUF3320 domain-containing protein [Streptomyces sp. JJ38]
MPHQHQTVSSASRGDPGRDRLEAVLDGWRTSLIDMGGRNRLLNFRHTKMATLELTSPAVTELLRGLARGWGFAPVAEDTESQGGVLLSEGPTAPGLVTQKATQRALDSSLYRLRQKSAQMFNDYGLWILWLGVGMLDWREEDAYETSSAPLLLVPVELRRDSDRRYRLRPADNQDAMHNPALAVKLERLGVDWSPVANVDVSDVAGVIAAARSVAARQRGWAVEDRAVLGLFASHHEAMYQDLRQNEDRILRNELIRAIALGPDSGLPDDVIGFEPSDQDRIDDIQSPEQTPLVLDADASQRQCVAAALAKRSFVMSGPPGTGKSQTITNMIASLMHAGRTVLFVSEKAAALDVVRNRLRGVGLGDFVMALHSGDTSKKAVAAELNRVLTTEAQVTGAAEHELEQARRLREELSAYAAAMNEAREPLLRTVHDVMGRLVQLEQAHTPGLPLPARNAKTVRDLSASALQEAVTAARGISRAWRPVADGESFAWRGLTGTSPQQVLSEAADALDALRSACTRRPFALTEQEPESARMLQLAVRSIRSRLPELEAPQGAALPEPEDVSRPATQLASLFGLPYGESSEAAFAGCELADLTQATHRPPRTWFAAHVLRRAHDAAEDLREALEVEAEARAAAEEFFGEQVLVSEELPELVDRFEEYSGLFVRFSAQYKADREAVTALTRSGTWDKKVPDRLHQALAWQQAAAAVRHLVETHTDLLAQYTPRTEEDLAALDGALCTADSVARLTPGAKDLDLLADQLADGADPDPLPARLAANVRRALSDWCAITERRADRWAASATALLDLFDATRSAQLSPSLLGDFDQAQQVLDALLGDPHGPEEWQAYHDCLSTLARHGAEMLVAGAAERGLDPQRLPDVVEQALLRSWVDSVLATDTRLRTTRSEDLDARVAEFKEADRKLIEAAGRTVIEACNKRRPRNHTAGAGAVIKKEAEKKIRHKPVRVLLHEARDVVRAIKPCFMMSPLTVSQFLPADFHFDVVIFDEASQVRPSDAVNCVYRGRSLVVAGDDKQLPPTSFFDATVEDDSDEYAEDVPDSFESLLHACKAGAMRELPLRWHYRSRHENLITFSNREFYDNSMVVFPGALEAGNDVGVAFFPVDGVYDRGGRRDNQREAEYVAQRVIHHFDTRPELTLGVVALSQSQASTIDLAVQQARIQRPDLDHRFTEDRLDGFFVKNLESVQGDERDVMIMSAGYGPDERGTLGLNFGPINKPGGWRRLNVAVTRARHRMEVVASFHGTQLKDSPNESVQYLKRYLEYAENGPAALTRDVIQADAEPDSPFEESVLAVLRDWGYRVQPQVGVAGYRIDLGIRHPELPGAYALGIECDGAMYHSSKAARDRDRLREQVLNGLGWRLYRIWGTDWYRGRAAAELRLKEAVEQAVALGPLSARRVKMRGQGVPESPGPTQTVPALATGTSTEVEYERVPVDTATERDWAAPYRSRAVDVRATYELHTVEARPALRKALQQIIESEGPIHEDLLVQRAREAWGVARAGSRIRDNVRAVAAALARSGTIALDGTFYDVVDRAELRARRPKVDEKPRTVIQIAPAERRLALYELAAECPGMSEDELIKQTSEFFGWKRTGRDIRDCLKADIAELHLRGALRGGPPRISAVPTDAGERPGGAA